MAKLTKEQLERYGADVFGYRHALKNAANNIVSYQTGKKKIVTFHHEHTNLMEQAGMIGKICFHGARPSHGKTYDLEKLKAHLYQMDNVFMDNVFILHHNMELTPQSAILRELKTQSEKTTREILSSPFNENETTIVRNILARNGVVNGVVSDRILPETISTSRYDVVDYENFIRWWMQKIDQLEIQDGKKYNRICIFDHLSVYESKEKLDSILFVQNELKLEFANNLGFYNYFQISRQYEIDCMKNPILPNSSHVYMTDGIQHYADIVSVGVIPRVMGLEKFATVYEKFASHLTNHIDHTYDGSEDKVRLIGTNRYYHSYLKIRDQHIKEEYPILYCSILNKKLEETLKKKEFNNAVEYEVQQFRHSSEPQF
jgi:hypothetical protein